MPGLAVPVAKLPEKETSNVLRSIPGIGPVVSTMPIAEMPEIRVAIIHHFSALGTAKIVA